MTGRLDEPTKDALRAYVDGTEPHPAMTPLVRRVIEVRLFEEDNWDELSALHEAEEKGDSEKLAELIETKGQLRTADARAYVAARVRGERRKPGNKLTEENMLRRIKLYFRVIDLIQHEGMTQSDALLRCLQDYDAFGKDGGSFETVKSDFQQGRSEWRSVLETLGFSIDPTFQVKRKGAETK